MTGCSRSAISVVKVGGSLLSYPHRWPDIRGWLAKRSKACHYVVITGGGVWADAIRLLDAMSGNTKVVESHWLAIRAMSLTAQLCAALELNASLVGDWQSLQTMLAGEPAPASPFIFDPATWLRDEERRQLVDRLPISWDTTSDSIAAHLVNRLGADELVLLKSVTCSNAEAIKKGSTVVDPHFTYVYRGTPIEIVNFRETGSWLCNEPAQPFTTTNGRRDGDVPLVRPIPFP